jgi:hypothetical protein
LVLLRHLLPRRVIGELSLTFLIAHYLFLPPYRFFYGDQRTPKGGPVGSVTDAEGHADMYAKLATEDLDVPWHVSFVPGQGYVDFSK